MSYVDFSPCKGKDFPINSQTNTLNTTSKDIHFTQSSHDSYSWFTVWSSRQRFLVWNPVVWVEKFSQFLSAIQENNACLETPPQFVGHVIEFHVI